MDWKAEYDSKLMSADEAVKFFDSGDVIAMQGGTGIPPAVAAALARRAGELHDVTLCQGFALAFHDYMKPEFRDSFRVETIFMGPAERMCLQWGTADFVPNHLGNLGRWLDNRGINKVTAVVTPPDEDGYMNRSCFGGLCTKRLVDRAETLVVEVNRNTPWLNSEVFKVHVSQCTAIVENDAPLFEIPEIPITAVETEIAGRIADMVA
ncbi:MAG: hypothetical protein ACM3O9_04040, partial [Methylocystaceae bacterium]